MQVPEHICIYGIQAPIFGLLYEAFPHLHCKKKKKSTGNPFHIANISLERMGESYVLEGCFWGSG